MEVPFLPTIYAAHYTISLAGYQEKYVAASLPPDEIDGAGLIAADAIFPFENPG
jgi:hypothetical protein